MATKRKKVPMRKCVATGEMRPKAEMIRIVRTKDGKVSLDPTGKQSGRGAYLSKDREAIIEAKNRNALASNLQVNIDDSIYEELLSWIENK